MKTTIAAIFSLFILKACPTDSGENLRVAEPISAISFRSVTVANRTAAFVVTCVLPDPCWKFIRADQTISETIVTVKILAERTSDACIQVLSSLDAPASVTVPSAGNYTFHFWRYGGTLD